MSKIKSVIYSISALIVAIIGIQILLSAIGANPSTPFVKFWDDLSSIFIGPWDGMFPDIHIGGRSVILVSAGIAALFYMLFGVVLETSVNRLRTPSNTRQMLYGIINGTFKLIEFLLLTRFLLKLFGASTASSFVSFVYAITEIIYAPFAGIIKDYVIMGIRIELTTLLILIIVIILDIAFDKILVSALEEPHKYEKNKKTKYEPACAGREPKYTKTTALVANYSKQPRPN